MQMKAYLKVADEKVRVEEKKVKEQKDQVEIAEKALQEARDELKMRRLEVEKLKPTNRSGKNKLEERWKLLRGVSKMNWVQQFTPQTKCDVKRSNYVKEESYGKSGHSF